MLKEEVVEEILRAHPNRVCATFMTQLDRQAKEKMSRLRGDRGQLIEQSKKGLAEIFTDAQKFFKEGYDHNGKLEKLQNLVKDFGQFLDSSDAMLTAPDVLRQMQACKDPEAQAQFVRAAVALKIIDSRKAREWVSAYGIKIGGVGVKVYPSLGHVAVSASASASASSSSA